MATIFDVAKYTLHRTGLISTWKLQKLCYYCQAWSLAWTEKPLFEEEFEAWANGPVCPELFNYHRGRYVVEEKDIALGDADALDEDQRSTVDAVLAYYGNWEPYALREQSHSEPPWRDARGDLPAGARCTNVITKQSMGEYYGSL